MSIRKCYCSTLKVRAKGPRHASLYSNCKCYSKILERQIQSKFRGALVNQSQATLHSCRIRRVF
jgi:hypothetical protein